METITFDIQGSHMLCLRGKFGIWYVASSRREKRIVAIDLDSFWNSDRIDDALFHFYSIFDICPFKEVTPFMPTHRRTEEIGAMPVPFDSFDYKHFTILVKHVDDNHRISRLLILEHEQAAEKISI